MVKINGHTILRVNDVYLLYDKPSLLPMFFSMKEAIFYVLTLCYNNGH